MRSNFVKTQQKTFQIQKPFKVDAICIHRTLKVTLLNQSYITSADDAKKAPLNLFLNEDKKRKQTPIYLSPFLHTLKHLDSQHICANYS